MRPLLRVPVLALAAAFALLPSACTLPRSGAAPRSSSRADAAAQRKAYERGVVHFGDERYAEARRAWQEAVRLGPSTPLGHKSQENLVRVENILKSLKELEAP